MLPLLTHPMLTRVSGRLTDDLTWKALGVEVLGINLPKTAIVRTKSEAMDVAVNEFGNTVGFFGGLWGGGKVLDRIIKKMRLPLDPNPKVISQGRVAKSLALAPPLVALMIAMPYFRNAFTAWNVGTTDYHKLITHGGHKGTEFRNSPEVKAAINTNLAKAMGIVGAGLFTGLLGFSLAAGRGNIRMFRGNKLLAPFNKGVFKQALNKLMLAGKTAEELKDRHAILYWGIPAYIGWMTASRDMFEVKEQFLKMINFILVYTVTGKLVNGLLNRKSAQFFKKYPMLYRLEDGERVFNYRDWAKLKKSIPAGVARRVLGFENAKVLASFGSTAILMAVLPALLNIYLTNQRLKQTQHTSGFSPGFQFPLSR